MEKAEQDELNLDKANVCLPHSQHLQKQRNLMEHHKQLGSFMIFKKNLNPEISNGLEF